MTYLSGGGASNLPVKLRTLVQPKAVYFPDYEDFSFGGEDIHEGVEPIAGADSYFPEEGETRPAPPRPAQVLPTRLDNVGAARVTIPDLPRITTAHEIVAELEYQDANGEILTATNRIDLWPAKINLGIRTGGWTATEEHVKFQVIALDLRGKPMVDQAITVDLFRRTTYEERRLDSFRAYYEFVPRGRWTVEYTMRFNNAGTFELPATGQSHHS